MAPLSTAAVLLVAGLHLAFFVLESLLWTRPRVRRIFGNTEESARATRVLALNQGFYNLGLAVLLTWFQCTDNGAGVLGVLALIVAMGLVGGLSANRGILLIQSAPAAAAFALLWPLG